MPKFYFTFSQKSPNKDKYVVIEEDLINEARNVMFETFGRNWAFAYTEKEFLPQIEEFNLTELVWNDPTAPTGDNNA